MHPSVQRTPVFGVESQVLVELEPTVTWPASSVPARRRPADSAYSPIGVFAGRRDHRGRGMLRDRVDDEVGAGPAQAPRRRRPPRSADRPPVSSPRQRASPGTGSGRPGRPSRRARSAARSRPRSAVDSAAAARPARRPSRRGVSLVRGDRLDRESRSGRPHLEACFEHLVERCLLEVDLVEPRRNRQAGSASGRSGSGRRPSTGAARARTAARRERARVPPPRRSLPAARCARAPARPA